MHEAKKASPKLKFQVCRVHLVLFIESNVHSTLSGPNGNIENRVLRMKSGIFRAEYEPEVVGTYRIEVLHQGKSITSHPFYVEVTDPASVRIAEVHEAYAGQESYFIRKLKLLP